MKGGVMKGGVMKGGVMKGEVMKGGVMKGHRVSSDEGGGGWSLLAGPALAY